MLAKRKSGKVIPPQAALQNLKYTVFKISMPDYEQHHYDKDKLTEAGKDQFFSVYKTGYYPLDEFPIYNCDHLSL